MKKIILFATTIFFLCACSDKKDEPTPETIADGTEYRLDSVYSYQEDALTNKSIYHYTQSNKFFDCKIGYTLNNNRWIPATKDSCIYDSKWNVTEQHSCVYNNGEWNILCSDYYYDFDDKGFPAKRIFIYFNSPGKEFTRTETQYKWDSWGNPILDISENYTEGTLTSYNATKTDYYYTGNHLDSTYVYTKEDPNAPFACNAKTIYMNSEQIYYTYRDNQFVLLSKNIMELDSHNNFTQNECYKWKDNNWEFRWSYTATYKYLSDTDLIEEKSVLDINNDEDENLCWKRRNKDKYFYTKL